MDEVSKGVFHWKGPHPDWKSGQHWDEHVSCYATDDGKNLLLFDPLAVPKEIEDLAANRETAIVLTNPWHVREAREIEKRLGVPLYVPPADEEDPDPVIGHIFQADEELPIGVKAFLGREPNDLILWVKALNAAVVGDTIFNREGQVEFPEKRFEMHATPDEIRERMKVLLDLPVEYVLPGHGEPLDRAALERALA
jgi:glyoxylase-like metal-dependent hydrolase (beta-lactamase superfamily II)